MQTSHFLVKGFNPNSVSISRRPPWWFRGACYLPLAPPEDLIERYERNLIDESGFAQEYAERILDTLDPFQVAKDLGMSAILLGNATPEEFCHRRLVANWLENALGIRVQECSEG